MSADNKSSAAGAAPTVDTKDTKTVAAADTTGTATATATATNSAASIDAAVLAATNALNSKRPDFACDKLIANLKRLQSGGDGKTSHTATTKPIVLISTGALCPVHTMHVQQFEDAKRHIEQTNPGWVVVGGFLSPTHDGYVTNKLRSSGYTSIDGKHRLAMTELATAHSQWITAAAYEINRSAFIDFPEVTTALRQHVNSLTTKSDLPACSVYYVCGTDHALKCGLYGRSLHWCSGVVAIGRPDDTGTTQQLSKALKSCSQESTILVPSAAGAVDVSSSLIRNKMIGGESVVELTGPVVAAYLKHNNLTFTKAQTVSQSAGSRLTRSLNLSGSLTSVVLCEWILTDGLGLETAQKELTLRLSARDRRFLAFCCVCGV